jgi:hypothetical protein
MNDYTHQLEERCKQLEDVCAKQDKEITELKNKYEPIVETINSDNIITINNGANNYQVYTCDSTFQIPSTISVQDRLTSYMEQEKEAFKKLINEVLDERQKNVK